MTTGQTTHMQKFGGVQGHEGAFGDAHVMASDQSPAERTGSEQDIAGVILFMASQAGAYGTLRRSLRSIKLSLTVWQ